MKPSNMICRESPAAAEKMGQLLKELLELSRVGRLVNPPEEVNLEELTHKTVELATARSKNEVCK